MLTGSGKILIVDDHLELAENMSEILELSGYASVVAGSAEEAIALFEGQPIAAVVTDFRLPAASGAELIAELRRRGSDVPAVVVSAYSDPQTIAVAEQAGALEVLPKPVDLARLTAILESFRRGREGVLIVEDNTSLAENLAEALSTRGFHVAVAGTVSEALCQRGRWDAAILDYRLPDGSGTAVAGRLAARHPHIRILFVTGYHQELAQELANHPGAEALQKPIDLGLLLSWAERALLGRRQGPA